MTDNEIIRVLTICSYYEDSCDKCPLFGTNICNNMSKNSFDFIKRQSAEIEALKNSKAETIKEFAERIKMAFYYEFEECIPSSMAEKIDEIVKEMTEGENG